MPELTATVLHHGLDTCIEVAGTGPRGGARVWTVTFHRRGHLVHGFRHEPPGGGLVAADKVPPDVRAAAAELFRREFGN